ncbi:MAG: hypothetical protein HN742_01320 [Lentisphaerae bacterium]|jgi:hypothetical protein|nr:hypothetical protein [Lentisphaerota bacterium]MBT4819539.1 hypothetical protein [Lentisphaerota bacterium]MBT5612538.1 hypothetical protein [Lentisphaerota bacterium]MBT7061333.1 hypothetical protein [Lentisphaerota bacterium]MBT7840474.1 hypothetical protein [Lentisphaerota bacterium]
MNTRRDGVIPVPTSALPLGDIPITFEVLPVSGGKALDRVTPKVVRLKGPFDK